MSQRYNDPHLPGEPSLESKESIVGGDESGSREGKLDIVNFFLLQVSQFQARHCHSFKFFSSSFVQLSHCHSSKILLLFEASHCHSPWGHSLKLLVVTPWGHFVKSLIVTLKYYSLEL